MAEQILQIPAVKERFHHKAQTSQDVAAVLAGQNLRWNGSLLLYQIIAHS